MIQFLHAPLRLAIVLFVAMLLLSHGCSQPAQPAADGSAATPNETGSAPAVPAASSPTVTQSSGPAASTSTAPANVAAAVPSDPNDPFAAGKAVFSQAGCARCHKITGIEIASAAGPGGGPPGGFGGPPGAGGPPGGFKGGFGAGGGGRAPDLAKVAAEPTHTPEWLAAFIRDPKSQKPDARMPAFGENKLSESDLKALVEFLSSLKG